ncbi:hypothetical protein ACQRD6_08790 [Prevotella sp. SGI.027]
MTPTHVVKEGREAMLRLSLLLAASAKQESPASLCDGELRQ